MGEPERSWPQKLGEFAFYLVLALALVGTGYLLGTTVAAPAQAANRAAITPDSSYQPPTTRHALVGARRACRSLTERLDQLPRTRWVR